MGNIRGNFREKFQKLHLLIDKVHILLGEVHSFSQIPPIFCLSKCTCTQPILAKAKQTHIRKWL